jgi:hypothetical protein
VTIVVDATPGTSTVRLAVTKSETVCVTRKVDVLPETPVATDVIVVLKIRVEVIPGTSIVRTVVSEIGTVAVVKIREVLPKWSVVSRVSVTVEISVRSWVVKIVEMLSEVSTV